MLVDIFTRSVYKIFKKTQMALYVCLGRIIYGIITQYKCVNRIELFYKNGRLVQLNELLKESNNVIEWKIKQQQNITTLFVCSLSF